jgi:hypothetical protein
MKREHSVQQQLFYLLTYLLTYSCYYVKIKPCALKMEAPGSLQKLVNIYQTEQYFCPEDHRLNLHCHENIQSY